MELTTFEPTKFGHWTVKLSYTKENDDPQFVIVASNTVDGSIIIKQFRDELEVIKFVNFLGEKYE